ncbi:hypothetical protein NMG60_11036517 [Bertholletia excelsa]
MAQTTTRVWLCVCVLLLFMLAYLADAADESKPDKPPKAPKPPKPIEPKKVKCKDKENFPSCLKDLSCPLDCPRNCTVDCASCQPVCAMPPPPAGNPYPPPQPTPAPYLPQPTPARSPPHPTPPPSPPHPSPAPSPPQPTPLPSPPQPTPAPPPPLRTPAPSPPHPPSPPHRTPAPSPPQPTPVPSPPHRTPAPSPPHPPSPPHRTPAPSPPHRSPAPSPPQPTPVPSPPHRTPAPSPPHRTPAPSPPHRTPAPSPPQPTPVPSPPHRTPAPSPPHRTPAPSPPHRTPAPSPPQPTPVPSPPQPSTPPPSTSPKKARCMHTCPSACPDHCEVDCVTCSPVCDCNRPGAICKDPRFDKDFCIISDSNLHINAHFIGRRNPTMKRDFTWIQSLGILFDTHQLYIAANKTSKWDDSIDRLHLAYDSQPISLPTRRGATWQPETTPGVSITRSRDANSVVIKVQGKFKIKATVMPITEEESRIHNYDITKDDCFAHLDLSFKFYSLSGDVNGILGQTYASNYVSRVKMGEFGSSSLFSTDCAVSRFKGQSNSSTSSGYINLKCASGLNGSGVVCKR